MKWFSAIWILLFMFAAGNAAAQPTVAIDGPVGFNRAADAVRPATLNAIGLNYEDCIANVQVTFPLLVEGADVTDSITVWAGTSCPQASAADAGSVATCWPASGQSIALAGNAAPYTLTPTMTLNTQDIVSQLGAASVSTSFIAGTNAVCSTAAAVGPTSLNIYLIVTSPGGAVVSMPVTFPLPIKMSPPDAPTNITTSAINEGLTVHWNVPSDTTTAGYELYCLPAANVASSGIGSTCPTSLAGTSFGTPSSCGIVSGTHAGTLTYGYVLGLTNGSRYAVAVTSYDSFGNTSALSSVACGIPALPAHSSSCTLGMGRKGWPLGVGGTMIAAIGFLGLRRRRRQSPPLPSAR